MDLTRFLFIKLHHLPEIGFISDLNDKLVRLVQVKSVDNEKINSWKKIACKIVLYK